MQLQFQTVDVFTSERFGGNPLAVVLNADGLSTAQMQAIAAEFNLSETTFVLPPRDPAYTAEVRIFTPKGEMPFAGHPNVGTAYVLGRIGESYGRPIAGDRVVFEEKAGLVPIELIRSSATITGARLTSPQRLSIGQDVAPALITAACSLATEDIATTAHTPCIASCGAAFILAELKSRDALVAARPRVDLFQDQIAKLPATSVLLYVQTNEDTIDIRARMFAPQHSIPEDPATGSANVALIGLLAQLRPEADLSLTKTIMQGFEMGRPSTLFARADKQSGEVTMTSIGGSCVPVMAGTLGLD
ncbi:PhzF family phenazine biosynthesis protein [Rhodopseudomonas sp. HC1]|uniref:PhzF family phenazine biosynthesis protein n=1 Tax=Rhodopseudomonas infernalis TaxID=2897386 RepID=UPI001EE8032E|nr:PhzF family phenazine biosynthesis protein [Rhodopseudomonas infernalis]MCG6206091.1 PhzF family phenazine biosynthesis protein [Rhodopseudomonas infernalis]